jgi:leader peptidase (prepilin peptidase)/N-methyltransferase
MLLGLRAAISAAATALALLLLRWIYALIRRRQGLGLGDVKLAAAIAAWLGARQMCVVFFLAIVTGALTALLLLALRGRQRSKTDGPLAVPFGTFLALAGIYCAFLGQITLRWYLSFFRSQRESDSAIEANKKARIILLQARKRTRLPLA